jgi:hypothetical protein
MVHELIRSISCVLAGRGEQVKAIDYDIIKKPRSRLATADIAEACASLSEANHGFGAVLVRAERIIAQAYDTDVTSVHSAVEYQSDI